MMKNEACQVIIELTQMAHKVFDTIQNKFESIQTMSESLMNRFTEIWVNSGMRKDKWRKHPMESSAVGASNLDTTSPHAHCLHIHLLNQRLKLLRCHHHILKHKLRLKPVSHKYLRLKLLSHKILKHKLLRVKLLRLKLLISKMHQLGRERLRSQFLLLKQLSRKLLRFHQLISQMLQLRRERLVIKFLLLNQNKLQSQETRGERREDLLLSQCNGPTTSDL